MIFIAVSFKSPQKLEYTLKRMWTSPKAQSTNTKLVVKSKSLDKYVDNMCVLDRHHVSKQLMCQYPISFLDFNHAKIFFLVQMNTHRTDLFHH